jgi:hypothetical protein
MTLETIVASQKRIYNGQQPIVNPQVLKILGVQRIAAGQYRRRHNQRISIRNAALPFELHRFFDHT